MPEPIITTAAAAAATAAAAGVAGAIGRHIGDMVSCYGKELVSYYLSPPSNTPNISTNGKQPLDSKSVAETKFPPYAVIGVGRCGSHITTELARMIASQLRPSAAAPNNRGFWSRFFISTRQGSLATPEPMMVVGDIDETTFLDVEKVLGKDGPSATLGSQILRIDYRPLGAGGAGHVPVFGQFLTRALLLLSPDGDGFQDRPWRQARSYLLDSCSRSTNTPRLIFYVFSAGGGTGAGSASEIMRAQRYAINMSPNPDPQIYFTGVAVIPSELTKPVNRRHLINTGRTLVQYLADLNIKLEDVSDYTNTPVFRYAVNVPTNHGIRPVPPWDGLMIISNDIMQELATAKRTYDAVEKLANEYAAQQMMALAASQIRSEEQLRQGESQQSNSEAATAKKEGTPPNKKEAISTSRVNFESTRLDPHDLKSALRGPYAVCFAITGARELPTQELDRLFLKAISVPSVHESDGNQSLIEGISVLPAPRAEYGAVLKKLDELISAGQDGRTPRRLLTEDSLSDIRNIPFFKQCPRAVFVFTAPEHLPIPGDLSKRFCDLLAWSMPNLLDARFAIVRSPGSYYALSIYVESSVILCPDVQSAIKNYIRLCWKSRLQSNDEYKSSYARALSHSFVPVDSANIEQWLGKQELYGANIPDYDELAAAWQARWQASIDKIEKDSSRKSDLQRHQVQHCLLSPGEITSAIKFLNYVSNLTNPGVILD